MLKDQLPARSTVTGFNWVALNALACATVADGFTVVSIVAHPILIAICGTACLSYLNLSAL